MERDPHQLIEGVLIACYAVGCAPGLPLRARRDGPGPGAHRRRPSTRPTPPATSARTSSAPTSPSTSCCTGAPAPTSSARRRRSSRASRATGACPASSRRSSRRPRASTCSPRSSTTSRRCPTSRGSSPTAAPRSPRSAPRRPRAPGCSRCPATSRTPACSRSSSASPPSATCIYAPGLRRRHPRRPRAQGVHPRRRVGAVVLRGAPRPAAREGHGRQGRLDARLGRHRRHGRDHRRGEGLPAASCGSSPASRAASARRAARAPTGSSRSSQRILDGYGRPERPRPADGRVRQHQPRHRLAAEADHDLPARPVGRRRRSRRRSMRFRDEFEAYVGGAVAVTVAVSGAAYRRPGRRRCPTPEATADDRRPDAPRPASPITVNGKAIEAAQGRAGHRRRRAQRRLHPALLLPPADGAGRHVPHVHRRDRHRPRPGPAAERA